MLSFIKNKIKSIYHEEGHLFQGKVLILYYFHLFIIFFALFAIVIYSMYLPQRLSFGLPIFLSGAILSIINISLLYKRLYNVAVYLFIIVFASVFIYMQFQKTGASVHTGYTSYFYLIIGLMIVASFFGEQRLLLILSSVIVFVNVIYFYLSYPHVQDNRQNYESLMSGFVSTMFTTLVSSTLLYLLKGLLDKAVLIAQEQTEEANIQYLRMFTLMSNTDLFDSVEEVSNNLTHTEHEISALIEKNNNALKDISTRTEKNIEETKDINNLSKKQVHEITKVNENLSSLSQHLETAGSSAESHSNNLKHIFEGAQEGGSYIEETTKSANQVLESIMHIAEITATIHGVAEKINMLSLNASIEASRAGEYGKGFSVVAKEISKLAERTSLSANDISSLVKEEMKLVQNTVRLVGKLEGNFSEISRNIKNMNKFIASIKEIIHQGNTMSFRLERVIEGLLKNSERIQDSTIVQVTDEEKIQEELKIIVNGMSTMKEAFMRLRAFSKELSTQSNSLRSKIIK